MWSTKVYPWPELEERLARSSKPFALDVVRHGQTVSNAARRFTGASDVPLSPLGERQAQALGGELTGHYDLAFHSTLGRSRRTLELALAASNASVDSLVEDVRLAERSLGVLEGRASMAIPEFERDDYAFAPEGGETYASVAHRVLSFLADLGAAAERHDGRLRALACTHVGPMRLLIPVLRRTADGQGTLTAKYANAEVHRFDVSGVAVPEFLKEAVWLAEQGGAESRAVP